MKCNGLPYPAAVRYGWVNNPEQIKLFNRDGLPASPFRTDGWPWVMDGVFYMNFVEI